jgi:serine/threonine protein phosphatase PrpC
MYATLSEPGGRTVNEDSLGVVTGEQGSLFVLADGLGGHGRGDIASQLVVEVALETYAMNPDDLDGIFLTAQDRLMQAQRQVGTRSEMKTTMVCLHICGRMAQGGHIGDSRLYHFSNGRLRSQTLDHSVPQMLVATGEIREKDIRHHEDRNRLIRVMGIEWTSPRYELGTTVEVSVGDAFLLCSDGFWEWIEEKEMQKLLKKSPTPAAWLEAMQAVTERHSAGANRDNYSAIAVFIK